MNRRLAIGLVPFVVGVLSCIDFHESPYLFRYVPYRDEIGTARATVVSVAELDDLKDDLSPNFSLTATQALDQVAPYVRSDDDVFSTTLSFALGLGVNGQAGNAKGTGSDAGESGSGGTSGGAGDSSKASGDGGAATGNQLSVVTPQTRYSLADTLFQEVTLLNRALRSFQATGYRTYLVGLDVALLPKREADYDANVFVSFESSDPNVEIQAIPLISQDELEVDRQTSDTKHAVELAFALSASGGIKKTPFEILSDFGLNQQASELVQGRSLNGLTVVARGSRNSLVAHFGATLTVDPKHTLVPQTKRIYAAIVIPDKTVSDIIEAESPSVPLVAMATCEFRDSEGRLVPARPDSDVLEQSAKKLAERTGVKFKGQVPGAAYSALWRGYVESEGEFSKAIDNNIVFRKEVAHAAGCLAVNAAGDTDDGDWVDAGPTCRSSGNYRLALGAALAQLGFGSAYSESQFWLPAKSEVLIDSDSLVATLDSTSLTVEVPGDFLSADRAKWRLLAGGRVLLPTAAKSESPSLVELTFGRNGLCGAQATCAVGKAAGTGSSEDGGGCCQIDNVKLAYDARGWTGFGRNSPDGGMSGGGYPDGGGGRPVPPTVSLKIVSASTGNSDGGADGGSLTAELDTVPVAAEPDGSGYLSLRIDASKSQATGLQVRLIGSSAVLIDASGKPTATWSASLGTTKKLAAVLALHELLPGQTLTAVVADQNGGSETKVSTYVVARPAPSGAGGGGNLQKGTGAGVPAGSSSR